MCGRLAVNLVSHSISSQIKYALHVFHLNAAHRALPQQRDLSSQSAGKRQRRRASVAAGQRANDEPLRRSVRHMDSSRASWPSSSLHHEDMGLDVENQSIFQLCRHPILCSRHNEGRERRLRLRDRLRFCLCQSPGEPLPVNTDKSSNS